MSEKIITEGAHLLAAAYNRATFRFKHGLASHPLFELPSLTALAQRLEPRGGVYWSNGNVGVTARWEAGTDSGRGMLDTLRGISENDSLVMLRFGVQDPAAGPVLRHALAEIVDRVGPALRRDLVVGRATILIASPRRVTSYHVDADTNFLLQIAGRKSFSVFDQTDRTLFSEAERESYFCGDNNAARFRPERENAATVYDLQPGEGVHVPCLAPHWARNGDDVSVAVSLNFDLRSIDRARQVHRLNHRLRRLGLNPPAPEAWTWRDRGKLVVAGAAEAVRRLTKAGPKAARDGWSPSRS